MRERFDLSIGQHLSIGFGLLLVIFGGYALVNASWSAESARAEQRFTEEITPRLERAAELERNVLYVGIALRAFVATPTNDHLARYQAAVDAARESLVALSHSASRASATERVRLSVERYVDGADQTIASLGSRGFDLDAELALRTARENALNRVRILMATEMRHRDEALAEMASARDKASEGMVLASVLALLGFIGLSTMTVRSVRRPALQIMKSAAALEAGDWKPALAWAPAREPGGSARAPRSEMLHIARALGSAAEALEQREDRLRAEGRVASATASSLDRKVLCDATLNEVVEYLRADLGVIYALDEERTLLSPLSRHATDDGIGPLRFGEGIVGEAVKSRRAVVSHDIPADTSFTVKLGFGEAVPRTVVAVPITFSARVHGALLVASLRKLSADGLAFLERASAQLGVGLQNVSTYERSQQLLAEVRANGEQIQTQNEELQAQNEEIQAQNEEIQAQSEQLQTQQEEIQAQNEELKEQSSNLRAHGDMLAEVNERQNDFLGVLAHELRNPMASIVSGLFILNHAKDPEQSARARTVIERQTHHLTRLIDDLLDITRISRGKVRLEREPLDAAELVNACVDDQRETVANAGLTLDLDLPSQPLFVTGDRTRLHQVVGNLLQNAVKFTEPGGAIKITLRELAKSNQLELRVSDNGVGMDRELLARLFQPFSQGTETLARTNGGLGLGLAVVKALIEQHEGTVEAKSMGVGRGSEFVVRLPMGDARRASEAPSTEMQKDESQPLLRILVIDDNVDAAQMLSEAIELEGHRAEIAHSGAEGIERALMARPDVVLCDIGLPTMDGYEVARRFRGDERLRSIFMIAVTGYAAEADQERALAAGFDRHLGKPLDLGQLRQLLRQRPVTLGPES